QAERPAVLPSSAQLDLFGSYREELKPLNALVILPASLVFNWQQELTKFSPTLFVYAHTGAKRLRDARALSGYDVVLTTYHTARQDLDLLEKIPWHFIVLDESQQIKNRDSEVSKVVRSLQGEHKISLSGTPIENSLADLWTQMEFINPDTLGSYKSFREQFQTPIEKQGDEQARARLFGRVKPFFMRRTKEEVAPDLPPLSRQVFYTEMPAAQQKRYERVKSAVRNEILSLFDDPKTRFAALQALTRLRQIANHPVLADPAYEGDSGKTADVLAQWDVIRRSGHKALFFSSFEQHLQIFRKALDAGKQEFAWLTGGVSAPERARAVSEFQEKPSVQAFLMTLGAGGVGLNLTAADYVLLLDPWWNPAKEEQAIARAHRIGRKHPVTAIRFIARDTIEEKILQLQERKRALGRELFAQGADFPALEREDVELLLE
ncbi:MAG: DEAD/DEAH box helicase, partial [Saprospiraceae bacterium]|nr:DEAD/DEAH box helicase [Saprospiraceae bacterium]